MHDSDGREFDAHAMRLDDQGNGILAWNDTEGFVFRKQDLSGLGVIVGFPVQCITPETQMLCHTGYELPEMHLRDLQLLYEKFGIEYPGGYDPLRSKEP